MTLKEKQLAFLQDTVDYYSVDPYNRRCVRPITEGGGCTYHPSTTGRNLSEGCAIGRKLSAKLAIKLDKQYSGDDVSEDYIFKLLPLDIQELGQCFLIHCQELHDVDSNWNSKGLSERGERYIERIKLFIENETWEY